MSHGPPSRDCFQRRTVPRAGEEGARRAGDQAAAERFHGVFEQGQKKLIELCWNGEYFQQHLPDYMNRQGEVGPGCMSDQLIGQWWAHQLGLGYLLPKEMVVSAMRGGSGPPISSCNPVRRRS